jgi:ribosome recycling factor
MEYKEIIQKIKPHCDESLAFLERELTKVRTGRASVALVEDIVVDCFGTKIPLKQLAAISCPEPRQIVVQPWEKSYIEPIEKALSSSGVLGTAPIVDRETIRIVLPPLTEEFRKSMTRVVSEKMEEARKIIRRWREEAWREIQDFAKSGKIREDDKFRAKDELQKVVDEYQKRIEEIGERKKRELEA